MKKKRSFMAAAAEKYIRLTGFNKSFTEKGYEKFLKKPDNGSYRLPKMRFKSDVKKYVFCESDVYALKKTDKPDVIILYLHGGAYTAQPLYFHWRFCDKVAQETNAEVIMPIYPLAPNATWEETYNLLFKLYAEIVGKTEKRIIFMGDSAGGGLALGFSEYLNETPLPQPSGIIALSPWLDVTMSNEKIADYAAVDPMIVCYGAVKMGELWAGDLDPKDYKVSPKFGNAERLHDVYLFVGTREVLYPDVTEFYGELQSKSVTSKLYIGEGMNHVYPLYPIPEGKAALKEICRIIKTTV